MIVTADHGPQPLRWIGRREITFGPENPRCAKDKPILIGKGSLGGGLPRRDLIVSPQHRMVLSGEAVDSEFGTPEVFGIAKALTALTGVRVMKGKRAITYYALLLDRHEVIFAEGAATESFRPGPIAMAAFSAEQRRQIFRIYQGLADDPTAALGQPARSIVKRKTLVEILKGHPEKQYAKRPS